MPSLRAPFFPPTTKRFSIVLAVCAGMFAPRACALPHNLLVRGCEKGIMLVDRSGPLPAIMSGAAPDEHPSLLAVFETPAPEDVEPLTVGSLFYTRPDRRGRALERGAQPQTSASSCFIFLFVVKVCA